MLDNEIDQFFRDRLLDHPSKVPVSTWKGLHSHLLRHTGFNFWKWYIAGPAAAAAAVTGFVIITHLLPTNHSTKTANAVATYDTRRPADSATTTSTPSGLTTSDSTATPGTKTDVPANTAAPANLANRPATPADPTATANPRSTPTANTNATAAANPTHRHPRNSATPYTGPAATHRRHPSGTETTGTSPEAGAAGNGAAENKIARNGAVADQAAGNDAASTLAAASPANLTTTGPPIPAKQAAPATIAALKTRPDIAARTPNAKSPHQLITPYGAPRRQRNGVFHIDVFGAPEYFTWKPIGISYSLGARVTMVLKEHWTLTTGLQYSKINVNHVSQNDSIGGLGKGSFTNLDLPLLLGYKIIDDRFSVAVNAGVIYTLTSEAHGALEDSDDWPIHYWNAYLGANFSTHVTDPVSLFAEPYVKCKYPSGDIRLPSQLYSTGLMLGLRYAF